MSAHEHPYLSAGAVPPSSHPEVPNLVLHFPYVHHQGNTCTNSLSSICFILSLESNNWQVKSLLVLSCLQYPASLFLPSSTEAEPLSKDSVLVLQLDTDIRSTEISNQKSSSPLCKIQESPLPKSQQCSFPPSHGSCLLFLDLCLPHGIFGCFNTSNSRVFL